LERDRPEIRGSGGVSLRQKDEEGPINTREINGSVIEGGEHFEDVGGHRVAEIGEKKTGPKPSGPGLDDLFIDEKASLISC
jgi:hypothetical protein